MWTSRASRGTLSTCFLVFFDSTEKHTSPLTPLTKSLPVHTPVLLAHIPPELKTEFWCAVSCYSFVWSGHSRSCSTQTVFFCSSKILSLMILTRSSTPPQESGSTPAYKHGSISSSFSFERHIFKNSSSESTFRGSLLLEENTTNDHIWPWIMKLNLFKLKLNNEYNTHLRPQSSCLNFLMFLSQILMKITMG